MTNKGRGTRWKAVILDYETLQSYDDETDCTICLTPRQAAALIGWTRGMNWKTRWLNLPADFDLQLWVDDIEGRLIDVCNCNSTALNQCICDLTALIQQQVAIQIAPGLPVIPPENPSENLPPLAPGTDPEALQALDAALCEMAKITVENIFELIYRGQVQKCNAPSEGVNFVAIGNTVAGALFAGAAIFPPSAPILFGAGLGAAALSVGANIFDYNADPDRAGCPAERVAVQYARNYGCQLFQALVEGGIEFSVFQDAFACPNPVAIEWFRANIEDDETKAQNADIEVRALLSSFIRNGDIYQGFIEAASALAASPYAPVQLCTDCTECEPGAGTIEITQWDDPRIIYITPATIEHSSSDWEWDAETEVTITFDKVYCQQAFDALLKRSAVATQPNKVTVNLGNSSYEDSAGGFGSADITIALDATPTKTYSFVANAGPKQRLDIGTVDKSLKMTPVPDYNDCS